MKRPFRRLLQRKPKAAPADPPDTASAPQTADPPQTGMAGLPLPSTDPATNFLIADIVLRAAGDFAREAIEKKTIAQTYDRAKADELVSRQSIAKTVAMYGITRIATRSPVGLAVVAGGLVLKALYDRGKSKEARGQRVRPKVKLPGKPKKK
jgi:hypothetical protein